MNIVIHTQGFALTPALKDCTTDTVSASLRAFQEQIAAVDVYLRKSGKSTENLSALVNVQLRSGRTASVEAQHSDLYAALRRVARRSRRAVKRAVAKRVSKHRARRSSVRGWRWSDQWTGEIGYQ